MATETQNANSIVTSSNLVNDTNVYADDTAWATASSNNSDSIIHVGFPTPSGNPTGTQGFTVKYRVTANANSVTFDAYVYENGTALNGGSPVDTWASTSTTEATRQVSWDASLLGTADGSLVEAYVVAIKSGGSPSNRTTGEFQYIDWDVNYAAADALLADDVQSTSEVSSPALVELVTYNLLADDVQSTSNVTTATLNTEYGILANDVQSTSEVSVPTANTEYGLLANDVQSTSELTTPTLSEADTTDDLLANDVESSTSVSTATLNTTYGLLSVSVQSTSEVSTVALAQGQVLLANDVQSASELTIPALAEADTVDDLLAVSVQSTSELTTPVLVEVDTVNELLAVSVQSTSELSIPAVTTVSVLLADDVQSSSSVTSPGLTKTDLLDVIYPDSGCAYYFREGRWHMMYHKEYLGTLSNLTYVSSLADLPAPSGGVITLKADHTYYFIGEVDLQGSRMVGQYNTCILGSSSENAFITSTGLGTGVALFTTAWTTPIRHVTFKDVDTALDIDGTGNAPVALDWTGVNFTNIPNIGTIKNIDNFVYSKGALLSSQGLVFDGSSGTVSLQDSLLQGNGSAGAIITIASTATITRRFRIIYSSVIAFGATTGLDVSVSASIPVESYILDTINFGGGGTYQAGVGFEDNKALFQNCKGITNSRQVSQYYMTGNTTVTSVASSGVAYKVAGTTSSNTFTSKFTNTDNRATYVGAITRNFQVIATLSLSSGTNQLIGSYVAKNGTILTESEIYVQTDNNGDITNVTIQALVDLTTNDYIEIYVENSSAATDITVGDLNVSVR